MPLTSGPSTLVRSTLAAAALGALFALVSCQQQPSEGVARIDSPIIGGEPDTTHKAVVSLLKQTQGGFYPACSGTLITPNLVLTAHHCVASLTSADGATVDCASTQFKQTVKASSMLVSVEANVGSEGLQPYRVSQVWVPDGSSDVCGRDIALLLLGGSGVPSSLATPIEPDLTGDLAANDAFAAVGYGLQDPQDQTGETAGHRMSVGAQVYCDGTACGTDMVKAGEFVAESPVCSGDSGGPALDQAGRVAGVTSRGDDKCTVGIYTSVYAWRDFIVAKTFDAATSGHYDPPAWAGPPPADFNPGTVSNGGSDSSGGSGGSATGGSSSLPLAGSPSTSGGSAAQAGTGTDPSTSPVIDPLGLSCTGQCPGSYKCWAASGEPPGICVPECSADSASCPSGYSCDATLGACTKPQHVTKTSASCSVRAPGGGATGPGGAWLGLALALWGVRRRRLSRAARGT